MTEMIINTKSLPETLFKLISTEKVKVREIDGAITLTPVFESKDNCPLRGMFAADSSLTVEKFLTMTHDEKDMKYRKTRKYSF